MGADKSLKEFYLKALFNEELIFCEAFKDLDEVLGVDTLAEVCEVVSLPKL